MASCPNHPSELEVRRCHRCARSFCPDCVVRLRALDYCLACKTEEIRDIQSGIDSARLDLASTSRRFQALFVDSLIQGCAAYSVVIPVMMLATLPTAFSRSGAAGAGVIVGTIVMYGIMITLPLLYEALLLQWRGQTLGKRLYGLKVVTPSGEDISTGQAWGRAGMRLMMNFCLLVDYIPAFFDKERKCVHDMAAGTRVIRLPR
jgi:uncharacterized RDD family membrane protein YckC